MYNELFTDPEAVAQLLECLVDAVERFKRAERRMIYYTKHANRCLANKWLREWKLYNDRASTWYQKWYRERITVHKLIYELMAEGFFDTLNEGLRWIRT